jgi:nucleotide-binding universal stress UspA family protein
MISFKNILVPIDFGEPSKHAVEVAVDLAKQYRGTVTLLHTWEIPMYLYGGLELGPVDLLTPVEDTAKHELAALLAETKKTLPETTSVLCQGVPWRQILDQIEKRKPDLVVMGTHGRHGIERVLLGSVAEKIIRTSPVPVLTVGPLPR